MPGHIHLAGSRGRGLALGHADLRSGGPVDRLGIGQSTCIGIGGDPIIGTTFLDALKLFNEDPGTHAIVMIGEIGGNAEETAARYVKEHVKQAGGRFHRRTDSAAGPPDGPCRRHHLGRLGRGRG